MSTENKVKIGLALGGGGPRGLAHIGVLRVLEENNIPIDCITGTSIGALVGGFYAASKDITEIEELFASSDWKQIISLIDPSFRQGLIMGARVTEFIRAILGDMKFKECRIPFSVVTTDLKTGEAIIFNEGEMAIPIRASLSFPPLFRPVEYCGHVLADGGLSMQVPIKAVKEMGAEKVIAVNLTGDYASLSPVKGKIGIYKIAMDSAMLLEHSLSEHEIKEADIVIEPEIGYVHWNKFWDGAKIIKAGEQATLEKIEEIKELTKF